jgi:hypothetical protein
MVAKFEKMAFRLRKCRVPIEWKRSSQGNLPQSVRCKDSASDGQFKKRSMR